MIEIKKILFDEKNNLEKCFQIRKEVFVKEQKLASYSRSILIMSMATVIPVLYYSTIVYSSDNSILIIIVNNSAIQQS